ncbi:Uncharacterised protein [Pseudomonas luteola]|uniref:Uncharacterized protein n=1 Tax=Pseudomonas luteola TaxID=47886 RepID=A0A2X2CW61_PSELU|nr:Uncharacterised protein [Pseudomonas luteola]
MPSWKRGVRNAVEQVEPFRLGSNGFREQMACQVRGVQPMAGISLGIKNVGMILETADLWKSVGPDSNHAAPLKIDGDPIELRKHLQHFGAHVACYVFRVTA